MLASDYRRIARQALRGRWWMSVLVSLVAGLLGSGGFSSGGSSGRSSNTTSGNSYLSQWQDQLGIDLPGQSALPVFTPNGVVTWVLGTVFVLAVAYAILTFVIGPAVELGHKQYYMRLVLGVEQRPFSTLFERFHIFGKALGLRLLMGLFIFLWMLLLIIPGIVAAYRYSMAAYLMAQDPTIGIMEAIDRSKELMRGNKARLFFLDLSFIGWGLLCILTLGLGMLFLNPYTEAARAAFFLDLTGGPRLEADLG